MSIDLTAAAEAWLAERHARGYLMRDQRWLIAGFLHGLVLQGINKITTADALAYAYQPRTSTNGGRRPDCEPSPGWPPTCTTLIRRPPN